MKQHSSRDEINHSLDLEKLSRIESAYRTMSLQWDGCRCCQYPRINERLSWECAVHEIRVRRAPIRNEFRGQRTQPVSMKSPFRDKVRIRAVTYKEGVSSLEVLHHPPTHPTAHPLPVLHTSHRQRCSPHASCPPSPSSLSI